MSTNNDKMLSDESIVAWYNNESLHEGGYPQLIVPNGCIAALILSGTVMDIKSEGKYDLTQENFPLCSAHVSLIEPQLGLNIIFYRSTIKNIKWGTPSPIMVQDQASTSFSLRASGSFDLQISNINNYIMNIMGRLPTSGLEELKLIVRNYVPSIINDYLSLECKKSTLKDKIRISTTDFASKSIPELNKTMGDMGLKIKQINIDELSLL
jgi:membrane protease subunit (stomatin/prohibitin family)